MLTAESPVIKVGGIMSNEFSYDAVVSHLGSQSDAIGRLAQDSGAFAAAVAAFESKDPDAFRWVLNHQEMLPYCELICYWVRLSPEDLAYFRLMRQQCATPIAMGDLFNSPHEWTPLIVERLIDYIRIHLSQAGGLTPCRDRKSTR